jgi:hypothetical protein
MRERSLNEVFANIPAGKALLNSKSRLLSSFIRQHRAGLRERFAA